MEGFLATGQRNCAVVVRHSNRAATGAGHNLIEGVNRPERPSMLFFL